jgi:hypothetical protein
MMQIMKIDAARERELHQAYLDRKFPFPPNIWRPTLTKEQEDQQKKDVESGLLPF